MARVYLSWACKRVTGSPRPQRLSTVREGRTQSRSLSRSGWLDTDGRKCIDLAPSGGHVPTHFPTFSPGLVCGTYRDNRADKISQSSTVIVRKCDPFVAGRIYEYEMEYARVCVNCNRDDSSRFGV